MNTPYFKPANTLKRIAAAVSTIVPKKVKAQSQGVDNMDGSELVDAWMEVTRNTNFEMSTRSLEALVEVLGYRQGIREFLSDNPGAQEKIVEFIRDWADRNDEWKESLREAVESESGSGEEAPMDPEDDPTGFVQLPDYKSPTDR